MNNNLNSINNPRSNL